MPNWCENTLTVMGEKEKISEFREKGKSDKTDLSLDRLYPEPSRSKNLDWRSSNWGCKWDVEAELVYDSEAYLEYAFLSPWSPPVNWLEKVCKDFPELGFVLKYAEPGMCFMGVAVGEKGTINDQTIEY